MDHALMALVLLAGTVGGPDWDTLVPPALSWDTLAPVPSAAHAAPTPPAAVPGPPPAQPPHEKPGEASAPPTFPCGPGGCRVLRRGFFSRGW